MDGQSPPRLPDLFPDLDEGLLHLHGVEAVQRVGHSQAGLVAAVLTGHCAQPVHAPRLVPEGHNELVTRSKFTLQSGKSERITTLSMPQSGCRPPTGESSATLGVQRTGAHTESLEAAERASAAGKPDGPSLISEPVGCP